MSRKVSEIKLKKESKGQQLISDESVITQALGRASSELAKVVIQVRGAPTRVEARLSDEKPRAPVFHLELADDESKILLEIALSKAETRECLLLVFMKGQYLLGMKSTHEGLGSEGLRFTFPTTIVKVQRREDARFTIPGAYEILLGLEAGKRRLVDISEKGLSFEAETQDEAQEFESQKYLERVELVLQGRSIRLSLEVKNVVGKKVGASFVKIAPEEAEFLSSYVYGQIAHFLF